MGVLHFWVMLILLGFCLEAQVLNSQNVTCNSRDLRALQDFLKALDSDIDGWSTNSSSNCCKWSGITCESSSSLGLDDPTNSGRVIKLELQGRKLVGRLSESLGALDQLKTLKLSHNFFKGSVPSSLFHLPNIKVLNLSSNDFSGPIPPSFNLSSIQLLDISQNFITGSIPVSICDNSAKIRYINFAVNYISGNIPPALGNCSFLQDVHLDSNYLAGALPLDLFRLRKLARLSLQDNRFSGPLSSEIGNLSDLIRLDISSNCFSGRLPDVFHSFPKLQFFLAQSNAFTGQLPPSLLNSPNLSSLSLRNNSLEGPLDVNCSAMTGLTSLDLASNRFSGSIPDNLPSCRKLKNIHLAKNSFYGQIPESFKNFHSLSSLSLSNASIHNITMALGILQQCKNLTILVLTMNFRGEVLPSDPSLQFKKLTALVIANCKLSGTIPQWLKGCSKLQLLDLSWNRLVGTIPVWFGNFQSLFYLDLSNNSFTGEIPKSITGLPSLINRNISLQDPSPDFHFFMRKNPSLRALQYNQIWSFPPTVELSYNQLTGPIWPEFGNLKRLHILDLKFNYLSGSIPSNLSGMRSIETLDLSHNYLSGTLPPSLVNLSFLSKFSVAYNQLYGEIPSGGQFLTFQSSSFEGNEGLCGEHASPCPSPDHIPFKPGSRKKESKGGIIGMAVGIGFGSILFLAVVFMIVLRAPRRRVVDPEREFNANDKALEEVSSGSVVLFQNKENNKQLFVDDLLNSTNNFDQANIIGCGGFGLVYKATLPDGRKVAIKRLSGECVQMEREFQAEVEALSRAQHPNLVLLQGYCRYKNDRLLMYSYMENSSLDYWLHEKLDGASYLNWYRRLQIARGVAKGLAYLHQSCEPHILHRDIKSSNILLDQNFEAHVADFGLARLILPYDTHVTTDLVGTLGYIPPEYGQTPVATYKGDVYSFGVVLLELLTGKRPVDICKPKGSRDLISWVIQMKKENRESEVFDPFIYDKQHDKEMLRVLEIACLCLSESPKVRPSTQQLVSWLDNIDLKI
ncbi:phytosulfokine receptor 1 [Malania oleifera]|uniref:phytosulfokine receptor 1 n=1 Tax=Malania oleifera TaxID=397392 RepID=UPI0025AE8A81|nr:phytosulfokine receptor 1 [Malania oleifera]